MESTEAPLNVIFARNLKRIRKKRGLTQYDLAELTGFTQRMIAHYETKASYPSLDKIEAIARALGVKPSELLETEEDAEGATVSSLDMRSIKKLQDILLLTPNDRAIVYRMVNKLLREHMLKNQAVDQAADRVDLAAERPPAPYGSDEER